MLAHFRASERQGAQERQEGPEGPDGQEGRERAGEQQVCEGQERSEGQRPMWSDAQRKIEIP